MDEHEKGYQVKITLPGEVNETDVKLKRLFLCSTDKRMVIPI